MNFNSVLSFFSKEKFFRTLPEDDVMLRQRFILFRIFSYTSGIVASFVFFKMYLTFSSVDLVHWLILALSVILIANFQFVNKVEKLRQAYFFSLFSGFVLLHIVMYSSGGIRTAGSVYFIVIVLYSFTLLGRKAGWFFTVLALLHFIYTFFITTYTDWTSFNLMENRITFINQDFLVNFVFATFLVSMQDSYLQSGKNIVIRKLTESRDLLVEKNAFLKEYNETLNSTNAELEKFAYVVSHDLKSPLRAISMMNHMLQTEIDEEEVKKNNELFATIHNRVNRLEGLLNALHEYSQAGRGKLKLEHLDLSSLISECVSELVPPENCTVETEGQLPSIYCDKKELKQVLVQLLSNAIVHNHSEFIRIKVSVRDTLNNWEISIVDNGPGIAEQFSEKVFEIFQTLKSRDEQEAKGIGLAIVKRIATGWGGSVSLEKVDNGGCNFTFTIPKNFGINPRRQISESLRA